MNPQVIVEQVESRGGAFKLVDPCEAQARLLYRLGEEDPQLRRVIRRWRQEIVGIARKRQWILDRLSGAVFMVDDDVMRLWCLVGLTGRAIEGPDDIRRVVENAAGVAEAIGAPVFGFDQSWDVRKFLPQRPAALHGMDRDRHRFHRPRDQIRHFPSQPGRHRFLSTLPAQKKNHLHRPPLLVYL